MKVSAITVGCMLLASMVWAEDVTVRMNPLESSSHVQVTVVLYGKPFSGVKVDFYYKKIGSYGAQSIFSGLTNENGVVTPPKLVPGYYDVVATVDEDVSTSLGLRVIGGRRVTRVSMDLTERFGRHRDELQEAEQLPVHDRVQRFQGIVVDPSGAFIPEAKTRIIKKGSQEKPAVFRLNADQRGYFSAQLADGLYIGFFYSPGFRTMIVPFEVTKDGSGDLRIIMQVGQT